MNTDHNRMEVVVITTISTDHSADDDNGIFVLNERGENEDGFGIRCQETKVVVREMGTIIVVFVSIHDSSCCCYHHLLFIKNSRIINISIRSKIVIFEHSNKGCFKT